MKLEPLVSVSVRKEVKYHPEFSLHKALFESHRWRQWIHPELLRCLDRRSERLRMRLRRGRRENELVDLEGFEGLRAWAPGIFSFPCFTDEFCRLILEEVGRLGPGSSSVRCSTTSAATSPSGPRTA